MELRFRLNRKIIVILVFFAFIVLIYNKSRAEGTAVPHGNYDSVTELCKQCHKTHEAPVPNWQHLDKKYLLKEDDEKKICYTCHNGTASPYNLVSDFGDNQDGTSSKASSHKVPEGQMVCSDCHTSHMKPEDWDANHDYNEVVRLLRIKFNQFWYYVISPQNSAWVDYAGQKKLENSNRFCGGCHGEDSLLGGGNIVDNYISTPHDTGLFDPPSGTQIKCMNCHNVHGADYPKLTIAKEENLCFLCHNSTASSVNNINIQERFTVSSDLKAHHNITDADQLQSGARIECVNCHNSHFDNKANTFSDPDNLSSLFTETVTNPKIYPTVVLQPDGNNGQDATILEQYPDTNYGSDTNMWVGLNGDKARSLFKFDLGVISSGSTVTEAKIYLPQTSGGTGAGLLTIEAHRVEGSWDESSAIWNNQPAYDSNITDSVSLGLISSPAWVGFTVTQLVSDWLNGTYSNYGIILIAPGAESGIENRYREFNSSENLIFSDLGGVLAARPKLIVKYTNPDPPKVVDSIGFCNKCHDGSPPAGVNIPFGFKVIASNYLNSSTGDYHGARAGTGYGGDIIGPYSRGMDAMLCSDCHDSHGSSNIYHLKESVNGKSGISVTNSYGSDAKAFCDACHTYYDSPPSNGCFDCHYHGSGKF